MEKVFIRSLKSKRAPTAYRSSYRRDTDFSKFSNDDLKFALDILSLHYSPYEVECANEIERRIMAGTWIDIDQPVATMAQDVPALFYVFPFSLLWKQKPQK